MPELPEVETIRLGLNKVLIGKKFLSIQILDKKIFPRDSEKILNKTILGLDRRAKLIIFRFAGGINMVVHLKMTGQFIYNPSASFDKTQDESSVQEKKRIAGGPRPTSPDEVVAGGHQSEELFADVPNKHTRVIFKLPARAMLYYNDLIRYSWIKIMSDEDFEKLSAEEFGPEPLSKNFTKLYLKDLFSKKRSNIKKILTDQKQIAGIGNIYADEILYDAQIDPRRITTDLKENEIKKIYNSIKKILKLGIKHQGSSIKNYVDHEGKKGRMQNYFKVYGKNKEKCECGGEIGKIRLNGRGTHFCPKCQK
jgi:formamidopyrimidine-DNA glycosylase